MAAATARNMPSSDMEAEAGRSASSQVAPPNLGQIGQLEELLRGLELNRIVADSDWLFHDTTDFHQRAVEVQYSAVSDFVPGSIAGSDTSSKAMALSATSTSVTGSGYSSHTLSIHAPPSLVSRSTATSGTSAHTSLADSIIPTQLLEDDGDGILRQRAPQVPFRCIFWFLLCKEHFDDMELWDDHCKSHLGDPLPTTAHCPFQCPWHTTSKTGEMAWQLRRIHIEEEHERVGVVDVDRPPSGSLLHHLWSTNVINNAQLKDIKKNGRLTDESLTYIQTSRSDGRRREREMRPLRRSREA